MFNIFAKLFSFLTPAMTPEAVKKSRLRQIARSLSHNRFARFYRPRSREITGEMGAFFYDVYKVIAPAQVFLQNAAKSAVLKQITAESFFDNETEEINKILSGSPEEWAKIGEIPAIVQVINEKLTAFSAAFNTELMKAIDRCYINIMSMIHFVAFDFSGTLKKFNDKIRERDFSTVPKFGTVDGLILTEKIKDFLEVASVMDNDEDWEQVTKIMKLYRNDVVVVDQAQWNKILGRLNEIKRSGILEQMIRHIDEDPFWQYKPRFPNERIAQEYLEAKQAEAGARLDKIISLRKRAQKESLAVDVFDKADVHKAQFYTASAGEPYIRKKFEGFLHAEAVNYLLAFLTDVFGGEINELCNTLLIRGGWIMRDFCRDMSERYHRITELTGKLSAFDSEFSNVGKYGSRMQSSIAKADKNSSQARLITSLLIEANKEALDLVNAGIRLIAETGRDMNALLEDRRNTTHKLIRNWKELDSAANSITGRLTAANTKINSFIQLMTFVTGEEIEGFPPA